MRYIEGISYSQIGFRRCYGAFKSKRLLYFYTVLLSLCKVIFFLSFPRFATSSLQSVCGALLEKNSNCRMARAIFTASPEAARLKLRLFAMPLYFQESKHFLRLHKAIAYPSLATRSLLHFRRLLVKLSSSRTHAMLFGTRRPLALEDRL